METTQESSDFSMVFSATVSSLCGAGYMAGLADYRALIACILMFIAYLSCEAWDYSQRHTDKE